MNTNMADIKDEMFVSQKVTIGDGLKFLDSTAKGILLLVDIDGALIRVVTDGDLRRLILAGHSLSDTLENLPVNRPIVALEGSAARDLLDQMNSFGVNHVIIVNAINKPLQIARRQDVDTSILLSSPHLGEEEQVYVAQAFNTNWIAPVGPNLDAFEQELADKVGMQYAVAVNSGTSAIHLALRALGVGQGDIVFCSSFTFVASVNPIIYQGASPVFIDSEPNSWNMSPEALERALKDADENKKLPKAVVVVSLYGQSADLDKLLVVCNQFNVPIVEDAAESLGATYKGKASGTLGRVGIYSFNGNKIITTSGGGMLVTNDSDLAAHAKKLATQAREPVAWYEHMEVGYNYRMSNILAGIGRGQLKVLDDRVNERRAVFEKYKCLLSNVPHLEWMPEASFGRSTRWLTTLLLQPGVNVELIASEMLKENIEVRQLWKPMHQQPMFEKNQYYPHSPGVSLCDNWFSRGLCLPSGSSLSDEQISHVSGTLKNVLRRL